LQVLEAVGAHEAEVYSTFGAVAEASAYAFAAGVARSQNNIFHTISAFSSIIPAASALLGLSECWRSGRT
jgi:hypothetical protein